MIRMILPVRHEARIARPTCPSVRVNETQLQSKQYRIKDHLGDFKSDTSLICHLVHTGGQVLDLEDQKDASEAIKDAAAEIR